MAQLNSNPEQALERLEAFVGELRIASGKGLPNDLQSELDEAKQEFDAGVITKERYAATEPRPPSAERLAALSIDGLARRSAIELACRAFAATPADVAVAVDALIAQQSDQGALADYLCGTADPPKIARALGTPIGALAFDPDAHSAIHPHHLGDRR